MRLATLITLVVMAYVQHIAVTHAATKPTVPVIFMEPVDGKGKGENPTYKQLTDSRRIADLHQWMDNEAGRLALRLYEQAWQTMQQRTGTTGAIPPYHIALIPGGNHAAAGFKLQTDGETKEFPAEPYIKLAPQQHAFDITFAHETGHVVLGILSNKKGVPKGGLASIPHTTSALTDRATAFNEGFAIHFETFFAHTATELKLRTRYHRGRLAFGEESQKVSEYHRPGVDLRSYAQNLARYNEVRDNTYAFATAFKREPYLRVQLDKARDFATLRDANQLLQSEGFYATFFFSLMMRGNGIPDAATIEDRRAKIFGVLADMFEKEDLHENSPTLIHFVTHYMKKHTSEARQVADVLLDLSHGVFVDQGASELWREYYVGGIALDIKGPIIKRIEDAREKWRKSVLKDSSVLFNRLGPQIPCVAEAAEVLLVYFRQPAPLAFDVNTAQPAILRLIPDISEEQVKRWITERAAKPFKGVKDFLERVSLADAVRAQLKF